MIQYEQGEDGKWAVTIDMLKTEAMAAGFDTVLEAQAAISRSPNAVERWGSAILSLEVREGLYHEKVVEGGMDKFRDQANRDFASPSTVVAAVVAGHFEFYDTADHHYNHLKGTPYADFSRNSQLKRDRELLELLYLGSVFGTDNYAASRVIAQEIVDPVIALQAYESLYTKGDSESFAPFIDLLDKQIDGLLEHASARYLESHIPLILSKLTAIHKAIVATELRRTDLVVEVPEAGGLKGVPFASFRPKIERVRNLSNKLARRLDSLTPPANVGKFVNYMENS